MTPEQPERPWQRFLDATEQAIVEAAGFNQTAGFGESPVLIVVDVTYAFCGDKAEPVLESIKRWPYSCGAVAWERLPVIRKTIDCARRRHIPIIFTSVSFRADRWDMGSWSWKNQRTEQSLGGHGQQTNKALPDGAEIMPELDVQSRDIVIYKQKPSAFHDTELMAYLTLLKCDSVILMGTTTSGCVRATAVDAFSRNLRVAVVEDGCFDRIEASHAISLFDLHAKYTDVVTAAEVEVFMESVDGPSQSAILSAR